LCREVLSAPSSECAPIPDVPSMEARYRIARNKRSATVNAKPNASGTMRSGVNAKPCSKQIVQTAPETLTLDQWKLAFRILIDSASYSVLETIATYYEPDPDPNKRRAAKDVLQDIIQAADQQALTAFVLRFTLLPQIADPDPDKIDLLKEAAAAFVPAKPSKTKRSKIQPISRTKSGRKRLAARGSK